MKKWSYSKIEQEAEIKAKDMSWKANLQKLPKEILGWKREYKSRGTNYFIDGNKDPISHRDSHESWMELHWVHDAIKCRAFSFTLARLAKERFRKFLWKFILSFRDLARAFITQFLGMRD